jgi:hypothetical protein
MADWLTYSEAAKHLHTSAEAVRQRAIRGRWQRTKGNDGKARVRIPDDVFERTDAVRTASTSVPMDALPTVTDRLISSLESHLATLQADLASAHGRTESLGAEVATERARADRAIADFMRLSAELAEMRADRLGQRTPFWKRLFG